MNLIQINTFEINVDFDQILVLSYEAQVFYFFY